MNDIIAKQAEQQKRHKKLESKSQKAFQRWLAASNDWVSARHKARRNEAADDNIEARQQLRKVEKRLDEAADAFEAARKALHRGANAPKV